MEDTSKQKVNWTVVARYDTYEDAVVRKDACLADGEKLVKINRMGVGGHEYGVKVGQPIAKVKKAKPEKKKQAPAKTDKKAQKAKEKKK